MVVIKDVWITPNEKWSATKSITVILQRYLSKDLAGEFSAQGKSRLKKHDFRETAVYEALQG